MLRGLRGVWEKRSIFSQEWESARKVRSEHKSVTLDGGKRPVEISKAWAYLLPICRSCIKVLRSLLLIVKKKCGGKKPTRLETKDFLFLFYFSSPIFLIN